MKKRILASVLATALVTFPAVQAAELDTSEQKISYLMGLDVGARMQQLEFTLDKEAFLQGLSESSQDAARSLSNEQLQKTMEFAQERHQKRQQAQIAKQAAENLTAGIAFLAENSKKDAVMTTGTGLQYKIITEGKGAKPTFTDTVKVHYRGTLIDGTEFDSSYSHGEPATFPLNGVIPGWTEALQLLSKGAKAELYIPSELAYGPNGMGQVIGPNSTLVFEVELLDINPAK